MSSAWSTGPTARRSTSAPEPNDRCSSGSRSGSTPTRGLERTVMLSDGRVLQEELQTPQGAWTGDGPVYTCAWIAAHPVEATAARVSCNASGDNGTIPRRIPEPRPSLDPALAGFVTGYREALADGTARRDGTGTVDGRAVEWLGSGPARSSGSQSTRRRCGRCSWSRSWTVTGRRPARCIRVDRDLVACVGRRLLAAAAKSPSPTATSVTQSARTTSTPLPLLRRSRPDALERPGDRRSAAWPDEPASRS